MRRTAVLLSTALALAAGASSASAHNLRAERSLQSSINAVRAAHGCGPLRLHAGLTRVAGAQARLLLNDGELSHDAGTPFAQRLQDAAPNEVAVGEDLAWGEGSEAQPSAILQAWMNSPVHRHVLLDCQFSQLGVGVASGQFGSYGQATVYAADLAAV